MAADHLSVSSLGNVFMSYIWHVYELENAFFEPIQSWMCGYSWMFTIMTAISVFNCTIELAFLPIDSIRTFLCESCLFYSFECHYGAWMDVSHHFAFPQGCISDPLWSTFRCQRLFFIFKEKADLEILCKADIYKISAN